MKLIATTAVLTAWLFSPLPAQTEQKSKDKKPKPEPTAKADKSKDDTRFTLENIFPPKEKPLFGPRARSSEFSHDGRWAAFLWRPYRERRHGSDLWLVEVASGKVHRITSATVMAEFQAATRKVVEHRVEKAKKKTEGAKSKSKVKAKTDAKSGKSPGGKLGDRVSDDDAADKKAPRYGGVSAFTWSPTKAELLLTSGSDIYRLTAADRKLSRLTCTRAAERGVAFLPSGKGYTFMRDDSLLAVEFGSHVVRQLDPKLPTGESMTGYKLSPDGNKVVLLARKGDGRRGGKRTVKIARYRNRFMDVREVPRHVSDDPFPPTEMALYLLDLESSMHERHEPVEIYRHAVSGPRDMLRVPEWSPNSRKVTFSVFEQKSRHVNLLIGSFPKGKRDKAKPEKAKADKATGTPPRRNRAKVAYKWLHDGGPNTPRMMQPRFLADNRHIVFLSEQTGFRHVHLLDPVYESQFPLTTGHYEVYPIDMTKDHKTLYVSATKEHPTRTDVYAIDLEGRSMRRLTRECGTYSSAAVSPTGKHVLAGFTRFGSLRELVRVDVEAKTQTALTASHPARAKSLTAVSPEHFSFTNRHGHEIHGLLFKPRGWRKTVRRPLLIYVYGGPLGTRKNVVEGNYSSDGYFFNRYMTERHGYLTVTIDPRGMSGYGGLFEKANFERVGKPQVEDLSDAVKHLIEAYGADPAKVGIHGWSFGGFQTQMCLYTAPDVFHVGIAGAGPTEWENYNSWYSTGTIGKSRAGHADLEKYSLLKLAKNLKGKLLLVHGMEDANVLYQDTVRVYRELLQAGKETLVELFLDPTGGHGLGGDVKRLNKARKYEEFLVRTLGSHTAPRADLTQGSKRTKREGKGSIH